MEAKLSESDEIAIFDLWEPLNMQALILSFLFMDMDCVHFLTS